MIALSVSGLTKRFVRPERTINVLNGTALECPAGSWTMITGASGCGKTTLLYILGGLDSADAGTITCLDDTVTAMSSGQIAAWRLNHVGFIFQSYQLLPDLSAVENVALAGRLAGQRGRACNDAAMALLEHVGLADRARHRPAELSGGEQQRIGIARALMNEPKLIIADEPTGNLDDANSAEIMRLLDEVRKARDLTIVMATHDKALCSYGDVTYVLEDGTLMSTD
jgi:ABC-type lipoprotein export system ATPase subunit